MFSREYLQHYKENIRIGLPVCLSQLGHIAVAVADTVMVGRLGGVALATATFAISVFIPFLMLGIGISYGVTPLVAKAEGEGNTNDIRILLKHSIVINTIAGIILALLMILFSYFIDWFDQPAIVTEGAKPFLVILSVSVIPFMIFQSFKQFAEGLAFTKIAMYIIIGGTLLNIFLNYLFLYGSLGSPSLGVNGAAYATFISRICMAVAMGLYVYKNKKFIIYWHRFRSISFSSILFRKIISLSLPVGVQLSLESGAFAFAAIMVGWIGANEISAHQIALNMASVTYMGATGVAAAATVRVGNALGSRDYHSMRLAGFSSFYLVIGYMSVTALLFIIFRHHLPVFYIKDIVIIRIATSLLLIAAFFQLSDGIQTIGLGALRGMGDVKIPTAIALVAYWVIALPVGYILGFKFNFGVQGIWYGLFLGLVVAATSLFARFYIKSRRSNFPVI